MARVARGRWRLALPWFAELVAGAEGGATSEPRAAAAEWLVARATTSAGPVDDWRAWLLRAAGLPAAILEQFPAGPCARASQGPPPTRGTWGCARPVHLLAAIDHLQLSPARVILDPREQATLIQDLNAHFADRGYVFHAGATGTDWTLECASPHVCSCVEPDGLSGQSLRDLMPQGPDGTKVRSLMNEIQMLLHEHPVNEARAARGAPVANAVWLWGFGSAGTVTATDLPGLYTDDPWLAGLWRMHGGAAGEIDGFGESLDPGGKQALLAWSRRPEAPLSDALARSERLCFAPARAALLTGRVAAIEMLLGNAALVADRSARLRFWRRSRPLRTVLA